MARQEGLIQLRGGLGNLSFYRTLDGYLVRTKVAQAVTGSGTIPRLNERVRALRSFQH